MRHWIKPWLAWAAWADWARAHWTLTTMREVLWPLFRSNGPKVQGLHYAYTKARLLVRNEPIPWNADSTRVEVYLRFPDGQSRRKTDFALRFPDQPPVLPTILEKVGDSPTFQVEFHLPALERSTTVEILWRNHSLGQLTLPFLSENEFLDRLRVEHPTVHATIGGTSVACQAMVAKQCKGLVASAILTSPTSLAPLLDLDLAVSLRAVEALTDFELPIRLTGEQLVDRKALVSVAAPRRPGRLGEWQVRWLVDGQEMASTLLRVVGQRPFRKSICLVDARYAVQDKAGRTSLIRCIPNERVAGGIGPCFILASRERGMAGLCSVEMRVHLKSPGKEHPPQRQELLVTDGPCLFFPGFVEQGELDNVSAFELFAFGQSLGLLSTSPAPVAHFTSEGGYRPPQDYTWTPAAEEELSDRLARLMETE